MENPMVKEINEKLLNDIVNNDFETFSNLLEFYFKAIEQLKQYTKNEPTDVIQQLRDFIISLADDRQFYQNIRKQIFIKNIQNDVQYKLKDKENKNNNYLDNKFISETSMVESFELFNEFVEDRKRNPNSQNDNQQMAASDIKNVIDRLDYLQNQSNDYENRNDNKHNQNSRTQAQEQEKFTRWKQCSYGNIEDTLQTDYNQYSYENNKKEWLQMIHQQNQIQKSNDSQQFNRNIIKSKIDYSRLNSKSMNSQIPVFSFPSYSQCQPCFSFPESITINTLQQFIDCYNKSEQSIFYVTDSFDQFRFDFIKNTIYSDFGKQHLQVLRKYMNRDSMVVYNNRNKIVTVKAIQNCQFKYRVEVITQNVEVRVQGTNYKEIIEINKEYSRNYDGFIISNRQIIGLFPLTMADLIEPIQSHPQKLREIYRQNKMNCLISRVRTMDLSLDIEQYFNPFYTIQEIENIQKITQLARFCQVQFVIRVYVFRKTHFCVKVCQLDQQINKQMAESIINSLLFIWNNQYQ